MIEKLGGRKFIISVLVVILLFILLLTCKITSMEFLNTLSIITGAYITGNVVSKFADKEEK